MAEALRQTIGGIKVRIGIQVDASVRETEIMYTEFPTCI